MGQEKNNKVVIALLVVIIIILLALCILLATGTINFKSDDVSNNNSNENVTENNSNNEQSKVNITILSIDDVQINKDAPNEKMSITGKMNLSYNSLNFITSSLTGYCVGENDEKYSIHPGSGWLKYNDTENSFSLYNTITQSDVVYSDGTTKAAIEINWDEVEIKSCIIEKFNALTTDSQSIEIDLNFEKEFK